MSIIDAIFDREAHSLQEAFGTVDITSPEMREAIKDWFKLYFSQTVEKDEDPCQQIPYTVVSKLTKVAFAEYSWETSDKYAETVMQTLDKHKEKAMSLAMIGGTVLLKPVPTPKGWAWVEIPRTNVLVFARDESGAMTDIGTAEITKDGPYTYTLLERRQVDRNSYLTIRNQLYQTRAVAGTIGTRVPLATLDKYAELPDEYTYTVPIGLGVVEVSLPMTNSVDGSADAVSVYAKATGLIHNINHNEHQINVEYDNAKSRLGVSADLAQKGKEHCKQFDDDVFLLIDDDPESIGFNVFSPAIRDESFFNRKREYLRNVETVIGLRRGLLSEVEEKERTATEINTTSGDYAVTVGDLQSMWSRAVADALTLCGTLGKLYKVNGASEIAEDAVSINWGNGILYDEEKEIERTLDLVARGMLRPEIGLAKILKMPYKTEADLQKIREKYMPKIEQLGVDEE